MKINKTIISKLKPCKDRFNNYLKFYGNETFTPIQFMELKNITQQDKLWVCFRLMPKKNISLAAADTIEAVLRLYESKHPKDKRPRRAIKALKITNKSLASCNAACIAVYAVAAYGASYASASTPAYATGKNKQEKLIREIVIGYMKKRVSKKSSRIKKG